MFLISDDTLIQHIASGKKIQPGDNVTANYNQVLAEIVEVFVDTELASSAELANKINLVPDLEDRQTVCEIVSTRLIRASFGLEILATLGVNPQVYARSKSWANRLDRDIDLGDSTLSTDNRLSVLHYPTEGWLDTAVQIMMVSASRVIQLQELMNCSYAPLAEQIGDIVETEIKIVGFAERFVINSIRENNTQQAVEASINYWFPRVTQTFKQFGASNFELAKQLGFAHSRPEQLIAIWDDYFKDRIKALNLNLA